MGANRPKFMRVCHFQARREDALAAGRVARCVAGRVKSTLRPGVPMNTSSVRIELDRDPADMPLVVPAYTPADTLVGSVLIEIAAPRRSARVLVTRRWIARAQGAESCGGEDEILLFEGDILQPGIRRFPFIFHVPPGPYSYHGQLIEVDWVLDARVEDAGGIALEARRTFRVEASGSEREFIRGELSPQVVREADLQANARRVLGWVGAMSLLLTGVALLYLNVAAIRGASWQTLIAGLGCLAASFYLARRSLRRGEADAQPWWRPSPSQHDYEAVPGDSVSFVVELKPNFNTSTRRVTALLRGVEQTLRKKNAPQKPAAPPEAPGASDTQVERHHIFEETVEIEPIATQDGQKLAKNSYRVRFRVPSDAPYSFYCPSASINWAIEVHVDVGSWPDWRRDFPLIVRPNIGAEQNPGPTALRS